MKRLILIEDHGLDMSESIFLNREQIQDGIKSVENLDKFLKDLQITEYVPEGEWYCFYDNPSTELKIPKEVALEILKLKQP
jgi:hypothetical protein